MVLETEFLAFCKSFSEFAEIYRLILLRLKLRVRPEHSITFPKLYKYAKQTTKFGPRQLVKEDIVGPSRSFTANNEIQQQNNINNDINANAGELPSYDSEPEEQEIQLTRNNNRNNNDSNGYDHTQYDNNPTTNNNPLGFEMEVDNDADHADNYFMELEKILPGFADAVPVDHEQGTVDIVL